MKAWYSGIGSSINTQFDVEQLSAGDQISLCHDLMRRIGYTSIIFDGIPKSRRVTLDQRFLEASNAFTNQMNEKRDQERDAKRVGREYAALYTGNGVTPGYTFPKEVMNANGDVVAEKVVAYITKRR